MFLLLCKRTYWNDHNHGTTARMPTPAMKIKWPGEQGQSSTNQRAASSWWICVCCGSMKRTSSDTMENLLSCRQFYASNCEPFHHDEYIKRSRCGSHLIWNTVARIHTLLTHSISCANKRSIVMGALCHTACISFLVA